MMYQWLKCCKNCLALCRTHYDLYAMKRVCIQCIYQMCFKCGIMSLQLYQYLYRKIDIICIYYSHFVK